MQLKKIKMIGFKSFVNPTEIVLPCIIATSFATIFGLIFDRFLGGRK